LLVNPLIKDEEDCQEYKFEQTDDINWKIHSLEADVCVFKNTNQSTFSKYNDNSITVHLYEVINNTIIWYDNNYTKNYIAKLYISYTYPHIHIYSKEKFI